MEPSKKKLKSNKASDGGAKEQAGPKITAYPEIAEQEKFMIEQRRHFHKHPELSFKEFRTAEHIAKLLKSFGFEVFEKIGQTGVVGVLKGEAGPGPCLMLRADMDALPLPEIETPRNQAYKSTVQDVMHACGHDGHMAILLGAAKALAQVKGKLKGHIKFCFQPAEEGYHGAREMIKDGLLEDGKCGPKVDQVFGLHLWSYDALGEVIVNNGPMMAASDHFKIKIKGSGGHGAQPKGTADAIVASASLVTQLNTITSRNVCPTDKAVVTVGKIQGGYAYNIISDKAEIEGTCRHMSEDTFKIIQRRMNCICQGVSASHEVKAELDYNRGYPVTDNTHAPSVTLIREEAKKVVGEANVRSFPGTMGAEDFSYCLQQRPGCFFFVGCAPNNTESFPHHKSNFDMHEGSLLIGASIWWGLAMTILASE